MRLSAAAAALTLFAACSSVQHGTPPPVAYADFKRFAEERRPKAKAYRVEIRLLGGRDVLAAPPVITPPGKRASVEITREFRFPADFQLPRFPKDVKLTPTTPTAFETRDTGLAINVVAKADGGFIMLTGEVSETTFDGFRRNVGDGFRPIQDADGKLITPNFAQSPMFTARSTPFAVAALPGRKYRFPINAEKQTTMEISCEEVFK